MRGEKHMVIDAVLSRLISTVGEAKFSFETGILSKILLI